MGCGPQAHAGLHIPNGGMQRAEGTTEKKTKKTKLQRTTDTFKQYMTDATHLVIITEMYASVKSMTAPGNIRQLKTA